MAGVLETVVPAARDRQQDKVYLWENDWPKWRRKTLRAAECRAAVAAACEWYNVPAPPVRFLGPQPGATYFDPNDYTIAMRRRHMNEAVCLHEAAHAIHEYVCGDSPHEVHGPEWLAIYVNLLLRSELAGKAALLESAGAFGLRYGDLSKHSPRRLRATYRSLWKRAELARTAPTD